MKFTILWPCIAAILLELTSVWALPKTTFDASTRKKFAYDETDPEYWYNLAAADIRERLNILRPLHKRAKNVVFFLGDGMGISTITAARILKGQIAGQKGEEGYLEFDRFPYSALIKTYNIDKQVPDSAGTATAYLTGVKANYGTIGVSAKVNQTTTDCDLINASSVSSILHWALDAGMAAGLVTTTRITHATPAASYAHVPHRTEWENSMPIEEQNRPGCKDIARQLVENYPGNRLSVILGGGRRGFIPTDQFDLKGMLQQGRLVPVKGNRTDGKNLIEQWIADKSAMTVASSEFAFVNNTQGLKAVNYDKIKYLLGLFNHSHLEYEQLRDKGSNGEPSLTEMTEAAIRVLKNQGDQGFVLLVEGGRIDHAHHAGYANLALYETLEFNRAIRRAKELLPMEDTLIVVTADHSHGLTINGYPNRGNPINGLAGEDGKKIPYTTLMYSNGPGHMSPEERKNKVNQDTNYLKYQVHAGIYFNESNHAGEDVAVFGTGPMAHFFGGTHEQSYIAHVVGYAACIGAYRNETHCQTNHTQPKNSAATTSISMLTLAFLMTWILLCKT